jgi:hypothetical protein
MSSKKSKQAARKAKPTSQGGLPWWAVAAMIAGLVLIGLVVISGPADNAPATKATIEVKGAPALKADKEKVDFGDVQLGRTVQVSFSVANVGDQPLHFTEAPWVEVVEGC